VNSITSRRPSPRRVLSLGRGRLATFPALFLLFTLAACDFDTAAKKVILGLNEVQDGAFLALKDARSQTLAAGLKCGTVARAQVLPVTPSPEVCKALGVPLPFNPEAVNDAIGISNAAYEAIRGANEARLALKAGSGSKGDVILAIGHAIAAVSRLGNAAKDVGVPFDDTELKKLTDYWNGRTGP
jgi:hypothetical protein